MPGPLSGIHFKEFTLGEKVPILGPIKVYELPGCLKLQLKIDYTSDVDIELEGPLGLNVGVKTLRFGGELIIRLEQLLDEAPVVGGVVVYFLNPPDIDFG